MWIAAAVMSSLLAGTTSVLSKYGLKTTDPDVATALLTTVVLLFAWIIVFITGAYEGLPYVGTRSWIFLILSGIATGASWICYIKALSVGEVSKVAEVDKSSVLISVSVAIAVFPEERVRWQLKLVFLAVIAAGTFLSADVKRGTAKGKNAWLVFASLSAIFAAVSSLLAKVGVEDVDSNLATAIRTCVVFVMAWVIVVGRKKTPCLQSVNGKDAVFLVLSGISTGGSWLCYYYAIRFGNLSTVLPIDRTSVLVAAILAAIFLREKPSRKALAGLIILTAGAVCMAVFT